MISKANDSPESWPKSGNPLSLVETGDGSKTIFNAEVGENYHSRNGALQESLHVFLNSGLQYFLNHKAVSEIAVLEIGFGTGLNFLLSADFCQKNHLQLQYTGIEAFPLENDMIEQTGYNAYVATETWNSFLKHYTGSLKKSTALTSCCTLNIAPCKLLDFQSEAQFDVIYFDAFAAAYQPEMWNEASIAHTLSFLKPGGVFVTYAITGNLKRIVKSLGCIIEKAPGALGKREMLRAIKPLS